MLESATEDLKSLFHEDGYLYKYVPLNGHTRDIFRFEELFFAHPLTHFNDPFDSRISPSFAGTREEYLKAVTEFFQILKYDITPEEIRLQAAVAFENQNFFWGEFADKMLRDTQATTGILSLTKKNDDILMFSHYAVGHRGLCLGFSTAPAYYHFYIGQGGSRNTFRVIYPESYEPPGLVGDNLTKVALWMARTKAPPWSYEEEWRVMVNTWHGHYRFEPSMLRTVIFGCLMPESDKQEVRDLLEGWPAHIDLMQAEKRPNAFALDIVPA